MPMHNWRTVNRDRHSLEEITRPDLLHEISGGLNEMTDEELLQALIHLDRGNYGDFGVLIASAMSRISRPN